MIMVPPALLSTSSESRLLSKSCGLLQDCYAYSPASGLCPSERMSGKGVVARE